MTDWKIHPDAPTDDEGHPVHPERDIRICARTKSDETTPTDHGRERDDIPYCTLAAGWGVEEASEGACDHHGGGGDNESAAKAGAKEGGAVGDSGGAPEDNTNAVTHALFVENNRFYQEVIGDNLRELCDDIYEGYVKKFQEVNNEPIAGEKARLSEIAVNQIKIIHSDNWAVDKPDDLHSGSAFVDKETRIKTTEHETREEHRYTESVVVKTQQRLRKEDRKWLKDMGLLGADAVDVNVDGQVDHDHEHGLDEATEEIIEDLADDLKA
jgi:hypothetical protein